MTVRPLLPLLLGGLLSAPASAADPAAPAKDITPLAAEMQNHWTVATDARDRIARGDLAGARLVAKGLAERPAPEALPDPWRPLYADMQKAADKVATADSLEAGAKAVGRLALTCSECHDFTGSGPKRLILPMPPPDVGDRSDMPLHKWGLDWLWIGLISADPESWERGAKGLETAPFHNHPKGAPPSEGLAAMEHLSHLLPGLAAKDDRAAQAARFGETLTACALCHTAPTESSETPEETP